MSPKGYFFQCNVGAASFAVEAVGSNVALPNVSNFRAKIWTVEAGGCSVEIEEVGQVFGGQARETLRRLLSGQSKGTRGWCIRSHLGC